MKTLSVIAFATLLTSQAFAADLLECQVSIKGTTPASTIKEETGTLQIPIVANGKSSAKFAMVQEPLELTIFLDSKTLNPGWTNFYVGLADLSQGYGKYRTIAAATTVLVLPKSIIQHVYNQEVVSTLQCTLK